MEQNPAPEVPAFKRISPLIDVYSFILTLFWGSDSLGADDLWFHIGQILCFSFSPVLFPLPLRSQMSPFTPLIRTLKPSHASNQLSHISDKPSLTSNQPSQASNHLTQASNQAFSDLKSALSELSWSLNQPISDLKLALFSIKGLSEQLMKLSIWNQNMLMP